MSESHLVPSGELRVVAAIGREFDRVIERETRSPRRPFVRAHALRLALASVVVLLALSLWTAPGKDAAAWVGELVGIGEVGGSPTRDARAFEDPDSSAVVIDNGTAPDGVRYEWVAYRCEVDLRDEGQPGPPLRGFGLALEWPGDERGGGGSCEGPREPHERVPLLGTFGVQIVPSQFEGVEQPDVVVSGTVGAEDARRVRVVYRDAQGEDHDLEVDFARVDGELRGRAGRGAPVATFVAFVDGEQASRDVLEDCLDLRALETVAGHHPAERCAEVHPEVDAFRERLEKCGEGAAQDLAAHERVARCVGPAPSPVRVIVYDGEGRELGEQAYPTNIPAPIGARSLDTLEPSVERGRRPVTAGASGRPVVLASGHTPDGAQYEYFAQKFARESGEIYSVCLTHWFPYVSEVGGSGYCGRGFPPTKAYGKAWPRDVVARSFGFLGNPGGARSLEGPATAHLSLEGFARAEVARVRVVYKDGKGAKRDAPVEFVRVRGALQEQVGSAEPFGFFVTFLPPSIRRYYDGPGDRADGPAAVEVIAYDDEGDEIGRFEHRN